MSSVIEKPIEQQASYIPEGIWRVTPEQYHADYVKVSRSMLEVLGESPPRYCGIFVTRTIEQSQPTAPMRLGSMKHIAVLQPEEWDNHVEMIPAEVLAKNGAKSTNEYKAWAAERPNKILAKSGELDTVRRMIDALHAHPIAGPMIREPGPCEQAITWLDAETGLRCKSMRDKVIRDGRLILDIKAIADSSPYAFSRAAFNFGYHRQSAWYQDGHSAAFRRDPEGMVYLAVGKEPPHDVAVYELDYDDVAYGRQQNASRLEQLADHLASGEWLAPHQRLITRIKLPRFAQYEQDWSM